MIEASSFKCGQWNARARVRKEDIYGATPNPSQRAQPKAAHGGMANLRGEEKKANKETKKKKQDP